METGSKISRQVIGARDLKDHLGRYLIQGLVVSVFLHSAFMTLSGLLPETEEQVAEAPFTDTTVVDLRQWREIEQPTTPPRPAKPEKPDETKFIPIEDEPVVIDSLPFAEELPDLANSGPFDGTLDTGVIDGSSSTGRHGTGDVSNAGIEEPWKIFVPVEVHPVALYDVNPQPAYPKLAQRAGVEGVVHVWVHVSDRGNVIGWHVIDVKPAGLGFEDEVARVIPQWKFTPAIQQNNPIAVWVALPFRFKISN